MFHSRRFGPLYNWCAKILGSHVLYKISLCVSRNFHPDSRPKVVKMTQLDIQDQFWAYQFAILVFLSPTSYMLMSFGFGFYFPFIGFIYSPASVILIMFGTSTSYFSDSTGSFIITINMIVNRGVVSPTRNVNPTIFVIPCTFFGGL